MDWGSLPPAATGCCLPPACGSCRFRAAGGVSPSRAFSPPRACRPGPAAGCRAPRSWRGRAGGAGCRWPGGARPFPSAPPPPRPRPAGTAAPRWGGPVRLWGSGGSRSDSSVAVGRHRARTEASPWPFSGLPRSVCQPSPVRQVSPTPPPTPPSARQNPRAHSCLRGSALWVLRRCWALHFVHRKLWSFHS